MTLHFFRPTLAAYDAAVDDVIAACNGDLQGALKALLIANEFLEKDLQKALASSAAQSEGEDGNCGLQMSGNRRAIHAGSELDLVASRLGTFWPRRG
jgi:hypothetical protein